MGVGPSVTKCDRGVGGCQAQCDVTLWKIQIKPILKRKALIEQLGPKVKLVADWRFYQLILLAPISVKSAIMFTSQSNKAVLFVSQSQYRRTSIR